MSYVYLKTEAQLWTVGHYDPAGKFQPESDQDSPELAAARVRYLNGGQLTPTPEPARLQMLRHQLRRVGYHSVESAQRDLNRASRADQPCKLGHFGCAVMPDGRCLAEVAAIVSEIEQATDGAPAAATTDPRD